MQACRTDPHALMTVLLCKCWTSPALCRMCHFWGSQQLVSSAPGVSSTPALACMLAGWLGGSLQRHLLSLAAVICLLEALAHAGLPGSLVPVVASNASQVNGTRLSGPRQLHMAPLIVEDARCEPHAQPVHLDHLHRIQPFMSSGATAGCQARRKRLSAPSLRSALITRWPIPKPCWLDLGAVIPKACRASSGQPPAWTQQPMVRRLAAFKADGTN